MDIFSASILQGEKGADELWQGVKVLCLTPSVSLFKALYTGVYNEHNRV